MEARKELMLKELDANGRKIQLAWFKKYYKKIYIDSGLLPQEIPRNAIVLYNEIQKWEESIKKKGKEQMEAAKQEKPLQRKWKPTIVTQWDLERTAMYPVDEEIKETLYNGISHNDEGRRHYLYLRNFEAPYDKFYEPQSYGMGYGWNIEERAFPPNKQFATAEVINAEFYRRSGVKEETARNRRPLPKGIINPELL